MRSLSGRKILIIVLTLSLIIPGIMALAQDENQRRKAFNLNDKNIALQGYDAVSYFMGSSQKGDKTIAYDHNGITYFFSNADNLDLFKKQPDKFEPVYGGWCAFAMGDSGDKVKIDPKSFKIIDGQLYMFYNFYFNNTLIDWNKDERRLRATADENWQKIIENP